MNNSFENKFHKEQNNMFSKMSTNHKNTSLPQDSSSCFYHVMNYLVMCPIVLLVFQLMLC